MLAVSPLRRSSTKDENQEEMESFSIGNSAIYCDFTDLSDENLLESINFEDLFVGIHDLPDLEMDPDMFAGFSLSGGEEESEINSPASVEINNGKFGANKNSKDDENKTGSTSVGEEIVSKMDQSIVVNNPSTTKDGGGKGRKSSSAQGKKRKVKVDWTPELHRRFVQAVEQLGVDKAVPSRILEIMGIDSLTRHNIASHLQKYRSHRKHLLAREAASWNQRRQLYGTVAAAATGAGKIEASPWPTVVPTLGFPPIPQINHFRPLHVWGHPSMDQFLMQRWPPPPLSWPTAAAPLPPQDPSLWHSQHQRIFGCSPVPVIPPHYNNKAADHGTGSSGPGSFFDFHPSTESIDAAIGDALSKPWLPLPLGLKAPALDSVMGELQRQGISNIPPSCS